MPVTPARGPRGSYVPGRGDITGRQFLANSDEKLKREEALKRTRNALTDQPSVLVDVPGEGAYLIPRSVFNEVVRRAEEQAVSQ